MSYCVHNFKFISLLFRVFCCQISFTIIQTLTLLYHNIIIKNRDASIPFFKDQVRAQIFFSGTHRYLYIYEYVQYQSKVWTVYFTMGKWVQTFDWYYIYVYIFLFLVMWPFSRHDTVRLMNVGQLLSYYSNFVFFICMCLSQTKSTHFSVQ